MAEALVGRHNYQLNAAAALRDLYRLLCAVAQSNDY